MEDCNHLFIYNKQLDLKTYIEIHDGTTKSYYNLEDKTLWKHNIQAFHKTKKKIIEVKKAIISFGEDCTLRHDFFDGESRVVASKRNSYLSESPKAISRVYTVNNSPIEGCTIQRELVNSWLKKL